MPSPSEHDFALIRRALNDFCKLIADPEQVKPEECQLVREKLIEKLRYLGERLYLGKLAPLVREGRPESEPRFVRMLDSIAEKADVILRLVTDEAEGDYLWKRMDRDWDVSNEQNRGRAAELTVQAELDVPDIAGFLMSGDAMAWKSFTTALKQRVESVLSAAGCRPATAPPAVNGGSSAKGTDDTPADNPPRRGAGRKPQFDRAADIAYLAEWAGAKADGKTALQFEEDHADKTRTVEKTQARVREPRNRPNRKAKKSDVNNPGKGR